MTDVVGRGTIELVGDARKLKASIEDAKKSIRTLGEGQKDITKAASEGIDKYIGRLQAQNATIGKSARETEIYRLALRGASNEQLRTADAALRMAEAQARNATSIAALKSGFIGLATIGVAGLIATAAAFDALIHKAGAFQDLGEKIGDTGENIASLAVSAKVGNVEMDAVAAASVKLTKNLTGVDDESQAAGAAIKALGLNLVDFKKLNPVDQFQAVARALNGFEEGSGKAAVAVALFGKAGAEMLPFLKELGNEGGRQTILTAEQIRLADAYSDKQRKLSAQISLHAQAIVAEMLPAYSDLTGAFLDVIKGIGGVQDAQKGLKNGSEIQDFAESSAKFLGFVVDAADGVVRSFQAVGQQLAAVAAITAALQRGQLREAAAIAVQSNKDLDAILNRPTFGAALDARVAARKAAARNIQTDTDNFDLQGKPKLKFNGAVDQSRIDAEAKAQLALDIEQIRRASEATIGIFNNAEKILEARRAANLVDDKNYFAAKLGFISLNSREQETALQAEIDRLQKETFVGKEAAKNRLENAKQIALAQAKLDKVRLDAVANIEINSIQEAAANQKLAQSYVDARVAADAYIESVIRRNKAELEGVGRGQRFREVQQGRNQIEDKFIAQRQTLERDRRNNLITQETFDTYLSIAKDAYAKELELYDARTKALLEKSGDWVNGANEALNNYLDQSRDIAKQTEELFTNAFKGMEDALVDFVKTGKLDFKSLADSIISDLIRIQVRKALGEVAGASGGSGGLLGSIAGLLGGGGGSTAGMAAAAGNSGAMEGALLGAFATGTSYVPRTGLALLHQGEAVIPAVQNNGGRAGGVTINQYFARGTDRATVNQAAVAAGETVQRALARNA